MHSYSQSHLTESACSIGIFQLEIPKHEVQAIMFARRNAAAYSGIDATTLTTQFVVVEPYGPGPDRCRGWLLQTQVRARVCLWSPFGLELNVNCVRSFLDRAMLS